MARMVMMVLCVVVTCMVVAEPYAQAFNCDQVSGYLAPCYSYLKNGGTVPTACCGGVRALKSAASTTSDRQTVCACLKSAYTDNTNIKIINVNSLPEMCNVNAPYMINPNTDCSKVL